MRKKLNKRNTPFSIIMMENGAFVVHLAIEDRKGKRIRLNKKQR